MTHKKAQVTAEFLVSSAIFLTVLSALALGIQQLGEGEGKYADAAESRLLAERIAAEADCSCLLGKVSASAESPYMVSRGAVITGNRTASARSVVCGGEVNGEPV